LTCGETGRAEPLRLRCGVPLESETRAHPALIDITGVSGTIAASSFVAALIGI
jgi:hypothetical protein